jgi:hypothetical protein
MFAGARTLLWLRDCSKRRVRRRFVVKRSLTGGFVRGWQLGFVAFRQDCEQERVYFFCERASMSVTVKIKMPNAVFKAIQKFQHGINADLPVNSGYEVTVEGAIMMMVLKTLSSSAEVKSAQNLLAGMGGGPPQGSQ